jgi:hypothetical protein
MLTDTIEFAFEVAAVFTAKNTVFSYVEPCNLVEFKRFGGRRCSIFRVEE